MDAGSSAGIERCRQLAPGRIECEAFDGLGALQMIRVPPAKSGVQRRDGIGELSPLFGGAPPSMPSQDLEIQMIPLRPGGMKRWGKGGASDTW